MIVSDELLTDMLEQAFEDGTEWQRGLGNEAFRLAIARSVQRQLERAKKEQAGKNSLDLILEAARSFNEPVKLVDLCIVALGHEGNRSLHTRAGKMLRANGFETVRRIDANGVKQRLWTNLCP